MQMASTLQWIIPIAGVAAILFALYLARDVLRRDKGTQAMQDVAGTILEGAVAFIRRQYTTIALLALGGAVIIGLVIGLVETAEVADTDVFGLQLGLMTAVAFLVGAACSMASGIIGMYISVKSNLRTASAAQRSLVEAVQVAMRGGAVSGFLVVALSLLGVWGIFMLYGGATNPAMAPFLIVGFGFGASLRGPLRPARRWYLHQGRRRRRRPGGQGRGGHPGGRPAQRGRHRRPRGRQRGRLRRPRRRPLRVHGRREHRGHDPRCRGLHHRPDLGLAEPGGLDLLPAHHPRLRPAGDHRLHLLRPWPRGRGPHEHAQPRLLGGDHPVGRGPRLRDQPDDEHRQPDRHQRHRRLDLLLRLRPHRPGHEHRLRLHHAVLHGRQLASR